MPFYVVAEFNTDENNELVYNIRERSGEPLPMCVYGPFEDEDAANQYCEDFMPDDTDVYDVWVTSKSEPYWMVINDPAEYNHHGYKVLVFEEGNPIFFVVRGKSTDYNEKKSVAYHLNRDDEILAVNRVESGNK